MISAIEALGRTCGRARNTKTGRVMMVRLFGRRKAGEKIEFTVRGMTCGHCEMRVQNALKAVPGVVEAITNLERERAVVTLAPNAEVSIETLIAAVVEAGYEAEPVAA
jgi:copper chaperone CopZ